MKVTGTPGLVPALLETDPATPSSSVCQDPIYPFVPSPNVPFLPLSQRVCLYVACRLRVPSSCLIKMPVIGLDEPLDVSSCGAFPSVCPSFPPTKMLVIGFKPSLCPSDLILTNYHLQTPYFQIRSQTQAPKIRTSAYLLGGHSSAHTEGLTAVGFGGSGLLVDLHESSGTFLRTVPPEVRAGGVPPPPSHPVELAWTSL